MAKPALRPLRRRLLAMLLVYCFAGAASQKLVPGVDEIIPFYGWSLFSKVPADAKQYFVLIEQHRGRPVEPPVALLSAPEAMVRGNRYIARKVVQRLGSALDKGRSEEVAALREQLEGTYLRGRTRYELRYERYDPLLKWRNGATLEQRSLGRFTSGVAAETPGQ